MKRANWKTIKLLNGYVLIADGAVETPPKRIGREYKELMSSLERIPERARFTVGSTPIRDEKGFRGWVILAAHIGTFEARMTNIMERLTEPKERYWTV